MGYSTRDAAELLGLPVSRIRAWTRQGLLQPERGPGGAWVYSFRDIVLLRTARDLLSDHVPVRRVRAALVDLRRRLPDGRPLSAVRLSSRGGSVVVTDEDGTWEPGTGQMYLELPPGRVVDTAPDDGSAAAVAGRGTDDAPPDTTSGPPARDAGPGNADVWYDRGLALEAVATPRAKEAYQRALELDPDHVDAHLNLGRILHEEGALDAAERHYRSALTADPASARAFYNLGVALDDRGRRPGAVEAYEAALRLDPDLAVAHFNLSRLLEGMGRAADALRHLAAYKRLLAGQGRNA